MAPEHGCDHARIRDRHAAILSPNRWHHGGGGIDPKGSCLSVVINIFGVRATRCPSFSICPLLACFVSLRAQTDGGVGKR